jgi:hypothetical protein
MAAITKPTNHRSIRRKKGRLETLLTMSFLNNPGHHPKVGEAVGYATSCVGTTNTMVSVVTTSG